MYVSRRGLSNLRSQRNSVSSFRRTSIRSVHASRVSGHPLVPLYVLCYAFREAVLLTACRSCVHQTALCTIPTHQYWLYFRLTGGWRTHPLSNARVFHHPRQLEARPGNDSTNTGRASTDFGQFGPSKRPFIIVTRTLNPSMTYPTPIPTLPSPNACLSSGLHVIVADAASDRGPAIKAFPGTVMKLKLPAKPQLIRNLRPISHPFTSVSGLLPLSS